MTYYNFLLDFFPLVDEIVYENAVLGSTLQVIALEGIDELESREKLKILLKLSSDLGYTSPEVVAFLVGALRDAQSLRPGSTFSP